MIKSLFLFFLFNVAMTPDSFSQDKNLVISLEGVRNDKGYILVSLFAQSEGFPDNKDKADKILRDKAQKGNMELKFEGLKKSTLAFAIIHDENDNQKLDTGVFGIPKEGFCFSRNAMGNFGPPDFAQATFQLKNENNTEVVKIKYW